MIPAKEEKGQIFYIGFGAWLVARILEQSMFAVSFGEANLIFKTMEFAALLIMSCGSLVYIVNSQLKYLLLLLPIAALVFLVVLFSDRLYIVQLALIIFMSQYFSWHGLLKCAFYVIVVTCLVVVLFSLMEIIPNYLFVWGGRNRYALGFKYVTYIPAFAFTAILLFFYLFRERSNLLALFVIVSLEVLLFYLTKTRFLCSLGVGAAIILTSISRKSLSSHGVVSLFLKWSPFAFILLPGISLVAAFAYNEENAFLVEVNHLLSDRLQLGKTGLEEWGIHPFGSDYVSNVITWENNTASLPTEVNVIDSSYLSNFIFYGWVITSLMLIGLAVCAWRAYRERDYLLVGCLLLLAIMGLFEPRLFLLEYNPFLIIFAFMLGDYRGCRLSEERMLYRKSTDC